MLHTKPLASRIVRTTESRSARPIKPSNGEESAVGQIDGLPRYLVADGQSGQPGN